MPPAGRSFIPRLSRLQYLAFATLCLIWGSTWMAIRVLVHDVPPLRAAAIRFVLADFFLIVIVLAKKLRWPQTRQQWRALIVLGITFIGLPYGLLFWAERRITSSLTAVIYSAAPLVVALFTPLMTHQRVPRHRQSAVRHHYSVRCGGSFSVSRKPSSRARIREHVDVLKRAGASFPGPLWLNSDFLALLLAIAKHVAVPALNLKPHRAAHRHHGGRVDLAGTRPADHADCRARRPRRGWLNPARRRRAAAGTRPARFDQRGALSDGL